MLDLLTLLLDVLVHVHALAEDGPTVVLTFFIALVLLVLVKEEEARK